MDLPPVPLEQIQESAIVVDISKSSSVELGRLKQDADVRWWLELGDQLVLVGDKGELLADIPVAQMLGTVDDFNINRLRLHGRGCVHPISTPGSLIAQGGRWELRLLAPGEPLPELSDGSEHQGVWREVVPDSIIAWRYRAQPMGPGPDPLILPIVDSINGARWFSDVETLAGWDRSSYGPELALSRNWIETQFNALGLDVSSPTFTMPGAGGGQISVNNVVGRWTGTRIPDEWIIVGGHYDARNASINSTVNTPGADDNASGCSGVIEEARALLAFKPERSILFMCYAGEEQGLYGSNAHVQSLQGDGDLNNAGRRSVLVSEKDWNIYPHYHRSTDLPVNMGIHAQAMGAAILRTNVAVLANLTGASDRILADSFDAPSP